MLLPSLDTVKTNYNTVTMSCSGAALLKIKQAILYLGKEGKGMTLRVVF